MALGELRMPPIRISSKSHFNCEFTHAYSEKLWEKLSGKLQNVKLKEDAELYPYIGRLSCKQGIIKQLQMGDKLIPNAKISVFPTSSPLLSECDAILGMQYFQDTVMVLDFNNSVLWVGNHVS